MEQERQAVIGQQNHHASSEGQTPAAVGLGVGRLGQVGRLVVDDLLLGCWLGVLLVLVVIGLVVPLVWVLWHLCVVLPRVQLLTCMLKVLLHCRIKIIFKEII